MYFSEVSIKIAHVIITALLGYLLYGQLVLPYQSGSLGHSCFSDIHSPAFDDGWWQNLTTGHMLVCGTSTTDTSPYLYSIGFSAWPLMDSSALQGLHRITLPGIPCSPLTEVYNPNINLGGFPSNPNEHDLLASGLMNAMYGGIITDDISAEAAVKLFSVPYAGGVSGIVWDNISTAQQASNLYFSTLGNVMQGTCINQRCAVKLSQQNLQ